MSEHDLPPLVTPADMLLELKERGIGLTTWEQDFLAKMARIVERGWELSGAQKLKLDQIYEERRS